MKSYKEFLNEKTALYIEDLIKNLNNKKVYKKYIDNKINWDNASEYLEKALKTTVEKIIDSVKLKKKTIEYGSVSVFYSNDKNFEDGPGVYLSIKSKDNKEKQLKISE